MGSITSFDQMRVLLIKYNMNFKKQQYVQPINKKGNGIHIMISTVHKHGRATCKNILLQHQRLE